MNEKLAIHGGPKAKPTKNYPMYPGGLEIGEEEKRQVLEVLDRKYLFRYYGPEAHPSKVRELEVLCAEKMGSKYALAVTSCTAALITSLVACGVGPGDEVIVSGYTFFASCSAIVAANAIPVICEIDETLTLDAKDLEKKITPSTKAIIVVHMRGVPCDMDAIMAVARKHNIMVIEDCAQAVGGTYKGKALGTIGDCGCFSFQYHKTVTAGEGGMIFTQDERLYDRCMAYHDTAACWRPDRFAEQRYEGELFCGVNYRMSELTGAVMLAQIGKLDKLLALMRRNQNIIIDGIKDTKGLKLRPRHDAEGDTGICLMFYLDSSDKLKEIFEICDRVTVLKDGKYVDTKHIKELTHDSIVKLMVGRDLNLFGDKREKAGISGDVALEVKNLTREGKYKNISFEARFGEILGFYGLVGAGRTEVMRGIFALDARDSGEILIRSKPEIINTPRKAKKLGIGFVTEDRRGEGLLLRATLKMNISMPNLRAITNKFNLISSKKEKAYADEGMTRFKIKAPSMDAKAQNLSGGNQQKVIIAKWVQAHCDILIFDEPTRGIDVGAKAEVYAVMKELADAGKCVIIVSSELPETLGVCDRIIVMREGEIMVDMKNALLSEEDIVKHAVAN